MLTETENAALSKALRWFESENGLHHRNGSSVSWVDDVGRWDLSEYQTMVALRRDDGTAERIRLPGHWRRIAAGL